MNTGGASPPILHPIRSLFEVKPNSANIHHYWIFMTPGVMFVSPKLFNPIWAYDKLLLGTASQDYMQTLSLVECCVIDPHCKIKVGEVQEVWSLGPPTKSNKNFNLRKFPSKLFSTSSKTENKIPPKKKQNQTEKTEDN